MLVELTILLLILSICGACTISFGIGSNDETFAPAVGSGYIKLKFAIILACALNIAGILLLGDRVAETLGKGIIIKPLTMIEIIIFTINVNNLVYYLIIADLNTFKSFSLVIVKTQQKN